MKERMTHPVRPEVPYLSLCGNPHGGLTTKGKRRPAPVFSDDAACQRCNTIENAARKRSG